MMKLDPESVNLFHPMVFENYGGSLIQLRGSSQALGVERGMKVKQAIPDYSYTFLCDKGQESRGWGSQW